MKSEHRKRLDDLKALAPGWDSYGANAIDPETLRITEILVDIFDTHEIYIFPTAMGGLQLEWWDETSKDPLSLEIDKNKITIMLFDENVDMLADSFDVPDK